MMGGDHCPLSSVDSWEGKGCPEACSRVLGIVGIVLILVLLYCQVAKALVLDTRGEGGYKAEEGGLPG